MWTYNYQRPNELYHHGVKGMKWGVRHDRPSKGNTHTSSNSSTKRGLSKKTKDCNRRCCSWRNGCYNGCRILA